MYPERAADGVTGEGRRPGVGATDSQPSIKPYEPRDPLWADLQDASLRADGERLADIGDWVLRGCPVELFKLGKYERVIVDAYCDRAREA
jgi:hypothetical protein